jgi:dipeptidyl aminopeptidase/acylaminoacyl peptidase
LVTTIWYPADGPTASATPQLNATPAHSGAPYPLIVFAHGYSTEPHQYEGLLSEWAAAGFVVAAPLFPLTGSKSPCGPVMGDTVNQPTDMSYVVTSVLALSAGTGGPLTGLVDANEIGAAGHSDGALTALGLVANTCCHDARIKAAAILAGTAEAFPGGRYDFTLAPPLLIIHGSNDSSVPYEGGVDVFNRAQAPKGLLTITGGEHSSAASPGNMGRAAIDFFHAYLHGDAAAMARLPNDGQPGVSTMRFVATPG